MFVIVKECATEACKSRSEAASHRGPDAKCGLAAFLRRSDWPSVKASCTTTAKTNCEMPIRGSKMQMTPDFEMPSREIERRKSQNSTVRSRQYRLEMTPFFEFFIE